MKNAFASCLSPTSASDRLALGNKPDPYFVFNPDLFDDEDVWTESRLKQLCDSLELQAGGAAAETTRDGLLESLRSFHRSRMFTERWRISDEDFLNFNQEGSNFFFVPVETMDVPSECVNVVDTASHDTAKPILKNARRFGPPVNGNLFSGPTREKDVPSAEKINNRKRKRPTTGEDSTSRFASNKRIKFSAFNSVQLIDPPPQEKDSESRGGQLVHGGVFSQMQNTSSEALRHMFPQEQNMRRIDSELFVDRLRGEPGRRISPVRSSLVRG